MKLNVETVMEFGTVRRRWIGPGQRVTVGGSEWADMAIVEDPSLSDIHFELVCDHREFFIRDLSSSGTWVNKSRVEVTRVRDQDVVHAGGTCFRVSVEGLESNEPALPSHTEEMTPAGIYRLHCPGTKPAAVIDRIPDQTIQFVIDRSLQKKASAFGSVHQINESMMQFGPIVISPVNASAVDALCKLLSGDQYTIVTNQSVDRTVQLLQKRIGSFVSPQTLHQHLENPAPGFAQQLIAEWDSILMVDTNDDCTVYSKHSCKSCLEDQILG